jgi:cytoskeleton protein RodZ
VAEKVVPVEKEAPAAAAERRRLVLRCEEESWIEVRDGADRLLVYSLNPAGTERVVEGVPPFSLVIGSAQHVRLTYGDREIDLRPHTRAEVARFTLK